jgi:hypothetical protein
MIHMGSARGSPEAAQVLDQAQPHGLGNVLGFRRNQPETADHASQQRCVVIHNLVPCMLVTGRSRID